MPLSEVFNIDCMEGMKQYPDKHFDLAIVDPPYGIKRFQKPSGSTRFKSSKMMQENGLLWDIKPEQDYFIALHRVSKFQIVWGANNFTLPESEYFLIWDKEQTVDNFACAEYAWTNVKKPAKIFRYSIHKHNQIEKIHPTQKPVELYRWLLHNYAQRGYKIIDTHLGSGSSRIAAYDMGYDFTGFEIDKDYFASQEKRFKQHTSQLTLI